VLRRWLGDTSLDTFRSAYLKRLPYAQPSTAHDTARLLDWNLLAKVLAAKPDTIVVARGKELRVAPPRTLDQLHALFADGAGLCVRHAHRHDAALATLARDLEDTLGPAQVQLFVTPPATYGFSWHYDEEDVFIVQALGTKEYLFRANTIAPDRRAHGSVFARFAQERSPICAATLVPGDFLYIPSRWWHMAEAAAGDPCLSISIGVSGAGDVRTAARRST